MGVCHVIIRIAAGGGSLAWHLAPSSERIPLSVRGDGLPCDPARAGARRHQGRNPGGRVCGSGRPAGVTWGER